MEQIAFQLVECVIHIENFSLLFLRHFSSLLSCYTGNVRLSLSQTYFLNVVSSMALWAILSVILKITRNFFSFYSIFLNSARIRLLNVTTVMEYPLRRTILDIPDDIFNQSIVAKKPQL